jgi:mycofactocin glycosyltransferase
VFKDFFASAFYLTYHLVRYYLVLILLTAAFLPPARLLAAGLIFFPALVEFARKKPRLSLPLFLFFYLAEQVYYQAGVFWGCLLWNSFRPYHLWFFRYQPGLSGKKLKENEIT